MIINADRTKTVTFARSAEKAQINITVNGTRLEQVDKVKYLGSTFTEIVRSKTEINTRIACYTKDWLSNTILQGTANSTRARGRPHKT